MINLMYLVLTAMLALNVSSEILNAFKNINDSIGKSNKSILDNNTQVYTSLDALEQQPEQRERIKDYNAKAKIVKAKAEELYGYLDTLKQTVIRGAGGIDLETGRIKDEGNIDIATHLFVEAKGKKGGEELKQRLTDTRAAMLQVVRENDRANIARQMPLAIDTPAKSENNPQGNWAVGTFYHIPAIAAVTMFSKFQNDLRNSEALILKQLMEEANANVLKFDDIQAIAVPKTSYALVGQKIEANIMLAAYNRTVNPTVSSSSGRVVKIQDGVANWETTAAGVGMQKVRGSLSLTFNGETKTKPWEFQYMVGSAGASMQLDKMNVFYIGVENPVTVTAAGYSLEDVSLDVSGGAQVVGSKGKYNVNVFQPGKVMATIRAKTQNGSIQPVGNMEIRVRMIPNPEARIAAKSGGSIPKNVLQAQEGIIAALDNFDFAARFQVTSYQFSYLPKRGDYVGPLIVSGPRFSDQVRQIIDRSRPGDRVYFEEVRAVGPDKTNRKINSVNFLIN